MPWWKHSIKVSNQNLDFSITVDRKNTAVVSTFSPTLFTRQWHANVNHVALTQMQTEPTDGGCR